MLAPSMPSPRSQTPRPDWSSVRAFLFDVDGVLTDARILVTETGELLRSMSVRDGYAMKRALEAGYRIAIVTGGTSAGVRDRFVKLGVLDVYSGVHDKGPVVAAYRERHGLAREACLYLGDDLPDLPAFREVGVPCAPRDADAEVLARADYVCARGGGEGCARELIEAVMRARGEWLPA